jgi:hypothetical protein
MMETINEYKILTRRLEGKRMVYIGTDGRVISKLILEKSGLIMEMGFNCFRIGSSGVFFKLLVNLVV